MSKETIIRTVDKIIENIQTKKIKKSRTKKPKKHKQKRPLNWNAIKKMTEKYDGLSKKEQNIANKTWGRPIPSWKKALKYHEQGLTDNEVIKNMGWKKKQS